MLLDRFIESIFHPLRCLEELRNRDLAARSAPWPLWLLFALIAIAGTLLYGASLHLLIEFHGFTEPALVLTVAAGMGWLVFGPLLAAVSRQSCWIVAHVCLVTMVYGEAILETGFFANLAIWYWFSDSFTEYDAATLNFAMVGLSNIVMAVAICAQMKRLGLPVFKTVLLWTFVLNGTGITVFFLLSRP